MTAVMFPQAECQSKLPLEGDELVVVDRPREFQK